TVPLILPRLARCAKAAGAANKSTASVTIQVERAFGIADLPERAAPRSSPPWPEDGGAIWRSKNRLEGGRGCAESRAPRVPRQNKAVDEALAASSASPGSGLATRCYTASKTGIPETARSL